MKKAMVEFEIDLTKMPLGKLSKAHLQRVGISQWSNGCYIRLMAKENILLAKNNIGLLTDLFLLKLTFNLFFTTTKFN
jgi:hypothetical protein